jgi:hypothetical protein
VPEDAVPVLGAGPTKEGFMRKMLRLAGAVALGSVLLAGCQKKEVTTTETEKTTQQAPEATPSTVETQTTTTSSPATTPTP